jgi:uncharacterized membrane protein YidH (DUF202 family)
MRGALKFIAGYLVLSAFVVAVWVLESLPEAPKMPQSLKEWGIAALIFLLALPVTLVAEAIGEWMHDNRLTRAIENRTKGQHLSGLRILYNLAYVCIVAAVVVGATAAWRAYVQ